MAKKLSLYRQGDKVCIKKVRGKGAFKKRIIEMGFLRDTELKIIKYAPLRDPIELRIKDFDVSIRVEEADNIYVELLSEQRS